MESEVESGREETQVGEGVPLKKTAESYPNSRKKDNAGPWRYRQQLRAARLSLEAERTQQPVRVSAE